MVNLPKTPLRFTPNFYTKIWGGTTIPEFKSVATDADNVGESWEISAVEGKETLVENGPLKGWSLSRLAETFGQELLGKKVHARCGAKFPLLVKLIDTDSDLSVQVHPNSEMAMRRHGCQGKNEMWYVIATRPGARIYAGLNRTLDPETYEKLIAEGTFADALACYESKPGDSFFIPAGTVHAIGAGNLIAEIQESSDITYRIYDYNRLDTDGRPRDLHIEEAKEAINFSRSVNRQRPRLVAPGQHEIIHCEPFRVDRFRLKGQSTINADPDSFTIVITVDGSTTLGDMPLHRGQSALIPASAPDIPIKGDATLLIVKA